MPVEDPLPLLRGLRTRMSREAIANRLEVSEKTIARWERGETMCPTRVAPALRELLGTGHHADTAEPSFTFADLFAGIGGIRLGFQRAGGRCVFTSEWNEYARKTYANYFGEDPGIPIAGDITKVDENTIPDHDILLAGFPCQPFSIAGVSKKNALGRAHGFADAAQGTLFFNVATIVAAKRPRAFLLENVKNLVSHDGGNTFRVIRNVLQEQLGYTIACKVVDGQRFVPQHRERILIAGFRDPTDFTWDDLHLPAEGPKLRTILHPENGSQPAEPPYTMEPNGKVNPKYTLTAHLWQYLKDYAAKHRAAGNGFGFGLVDGDGVARTLSARYYKDGSEILVSRGKRARPRRLTPRECARLMGFPDDFGIPVSDTQAYRQFGNSVVVPVIEAAARIIVPRVLEAKETEASGVKQARLPLVA